MKLYSYLSLMGLADIANCFDASASYAVTTDGATKYITMAPKSTHAKTMLYLHGGGSSAAGAYGYLKTQQIATLDTKVIIMNAPISTGNGYVWYDTVPKGTGTTDSLGNDIVGVQTGSNSLDAITTTILALIDTEKAALPSGKQSYANISVVGFS
jgi:predicted esterase